MAATIRYGRVFTILICCSHLYLTHQETVLGEENEDFDFDGLPGAQHEFKIDIPAGRQECFYQKIAEGANIHVSYELRLCHPKSNFYVRFEDPVLNSVEDMTTGQDLPLMHNKMKKVRRLMVLVLRGSDRQIDVFLTDPAHNLVEAQTYKTEGYIEKPATSTGIYTLCVDNTINRVYSKLVYVYIVTFVMEEWTKYVKEIEDLSTTVSNFTHAISEVQKSLTEVKIHQAQSRLHVVKDWYLVTGNNKYIVNWSILQIVVVLATSIFTVYFVRRLFRIPNVTPSDKPRA